MPTETAARAERRPPNAPEEDDYEAFCSALSASARGRAFLAEYTRRNRNADTEQLLDAIAKLQTSIAANAAPMATDRVKTELRALLDEIVAAHNELESSIIEIRAARLAELVALVERRITGIMALVRPESAPLPEVATPALPDEANEAAERTHLVIVSVPEQPELPIPSPVATQPPSIALVRSDVIMAEVVFVETPPAPIVRLEPVTIEMPKAEAATTPAVTPPAKPATSANPLASIMALREEERLALFT
ncbi:MAG TPA: hypothetical protein VIV34_02360 [Pseudolabrys sp.]